MNYYVEVIYIRNGINDSYSDSDVFLVDYFHMVKGK